MRILGAALGEGQRVLPLPLFPKFLQLEICNVPYFGVVCSVIKIFSNCHFCAPTMCQIQFVKGEYREDDIANEKG